MTFKTGDMVRVKYTDTLEGVVKGAAVNEQSDFCFLVEYVDHQGETTERYFKLEEIEAAV